MKKIIYFFLDKLFYIVILYFLLQLILVLFFLPEFKSDSSYYFRLAQECISLNTIYPAKIHTYENFISAPLYINFSIIILKIYNSPITIGIFNIILNGSILILIYRITSILINKEAAKISILIFIFYLNSLGLVTLNLTELFFLFLVLLSIYFFLKEGKNRYFFAGLFAAASVSVRPMGVFLLLAYLIYFFILRKNQKIIISFSLNLAGFLFFILSFGFLTKIVFGSFIFMPTNGSYNLLIGANDFVHGGYNEDVFFMNQQKLLPDSSLTYIERNELWEKEALNWIKENPFKWISFVPLKLFHALAWDDVAVSNLTLSYEWNLVKIVKYVLEKKSINGLFEGKSALFKTGFIILHLYHFLFYLLFLYMVVSGFYKLKKNQDTALKKYWIISLIFIVCNLVVISIYFGAPRFKYPLMIISIPAASYKILSTLNRSK